MPLEIVSRLPKIKDEIKKSNEQESDFQCTSTVKHVPLVKLERRKTGELSF